MVDGTVTLSPEQLDNQYNEIVHFLSYVHPSLLETEGYRPCVELRPLLRVEGKGTFMLKRSLQLWELDERSLERLRAFLARHNGQPTCLYYSVYDYDNNVEAVTAKGTKAKAGKITSASALGAQEIALDFDRIDFEQYVQLVDQFESVGLHAMWVFSGHGYQAHILLDQRVTDKTALRQMVYKFRSKGFDCDPACTDPARVMRLPGTHNYKCLKEEAYAHERENPPHCAIVMETEERYTLEDVFMKLDTLPTVSKADEEEFLSLLPVPKKNNSTPADTPASTGEVQEASDVVRVFRVEYPFLSDYELPSPVQKMLAETPDGYRNQTLGFLIRHFKTSCKLSKDAIYEILKIWAEHACIPSYDPGEFERDFTRLYYHGGLKYTSALADKFGTLDPEQLIRLRKQNILIPNKFFRSFDQLDGKTVRLYLAIKMLEHFEEETTQENIADLLSISTRALRPTLQTLVKSGHAFLRKGNARNKLPSTYHTSHIVSAQDGYMPFSYNDISVYVNDLFVNGSRGNGELKLYLFLRYKFYSDEIYMSQRTMGQHIGVAQTTISGLVTRLEERRFLKIRRVIRTNGIESCEYILLR